METDFSYIKSLSTARLVEIINDVDGFEETQEAITELKNRAAVLALELAVKLLLIILEMIICRDMSLD